MSNRTPTSTAPAQGIYVALVTPREPDSVEANASALLDYIDIIGTKGVDGLVLFGTTGEFIHYDFAERIRVLSLAVKRSRVPLLVNVSHSSSAGAIDLAENAVEAGAAGILLMPPYFFHYSDDQIFAFYRQFIKAVGGSIPIYLYNMPFFTDPISPSLVKRLLSTGAFAGIKDSSGDWDLFEAIRSVRERVSFQNLSGNDRIYAKVRRAGADGIISGVAAFAPELMVALDRALVSQNSARIELLDRFLQSLIPQLNRFPVPIATKQAAIARGWKTGNDTLPFDETTLAELGNFQAWFEQWLPAVLAAAADA